MKKLQNTITIHKKEKLKKLKEQTKQNISIPDKTI